jgi:signal transduction histidine kinase
MLPLLAILCFQGGILRAKDVARIEVFVDQEEKPHTGVVLTVPPGTNTLRFNVQPESLAVRYKLDGLNDDWVGRNDTMVFRLRFVNGDGDPVRMEAFPVSGASPGWNGSLEKSEFSPRVERVTVPEGAVNVAFLMSSGGPASLLGVYALKDLNVSVTSGDGGDSRILLAKNHSGAETQGFWSKSGIHPSMAFVAAPGEGQGALRYPAILDNDPDAHADWISRVGAIPKVTPGEILEIRWEEIYSTVLGGGFTATYERLPPGNYRFVVQDISLVGEPEDSVKSVSLIVPRLLWKRPWFWAVSLGSLALLGAVVGRHLIRRRIRFHLLQEQMISEERRRIALDLHDDLGTRLSHISLMSSHASNTVMHEGAKDAFGKISAMSRDLIGALSETVWMLNSKNDDLESLVDFLYRLVNELCRLKKIRCKVNAVHITEHRPISYDFRHNVSLAVKESVNNALKHSEATELNMSIELEKNILTVTITDNGIGFSEGSISAGLGLESLGLRMKSVGGSCKFRHLAEGGVRIVLSAPVA